MGPLGLRRAVPGKVKRTLTAGAAPKTTIRAVADRGRTGGGHLGIRWRRWAAVGLPGGAVASQAAFERCELLCVEYSRTSAERGNSASRGSSKLSANKSFLV